MASRKHHEYRPGAHGITNDFNLKQVATTQMLSSVVDLRNLESVSICAVVTITGTPTTGKIKAIAIPYGTDGSTQIGPQIDLTAASAAQTASINCVVGAAKGNAAKAINFGAVDADTDLLFSIPKAKLGIEITEINNGTTATCDVYVNVQRAI